MWKERRGQAKKIVIDRIIDQLSDPIEFNVTMSTESVSLSLSILISDTEQEKEKNLHLLHQHHCYLSSLLTMKVDWAWQYSSWDIGSVLTCCYSMCTGLVRGIFFRLRPRWAASRVLIATHCSPKHECWAQRRRVPNSTERLSHSRSESHRLEKRAYRTSSNDARWVIHHFDTNHRREGKEKRSNKTWKLVEATHAICLVSPLFLSSCVSFSSTINTVRHAASFSPGIGHLEYTNLHLSDDLHRCSTMAEIEASYSLRNSVCAKACLLHSEKKIRWQENPRTESIWAW